MVVINGVEQLPCIAQLHAHKQMHDICIARGSIISTRVAQTAKKTGYSAYAHEQGHGLAVALAVIKVAPAVPHAVHDELYLLVAIGPRAVQRLLRNVVHIHGFAQAPQRSSVKQAGHGADSEGGGRTGLVACMHECDAGGDGVRGNLRTRCVTAQLADDTKQRRHGSHNLGDGKAVAVREPVTRDEDVCDEVLELEVRIVCVWAGQPQLHGNNLHESLLKHLTHYKTAQRESAYKAKAREKRPSCYSHVPRPGEFHEGLHAFAEQLLEFKKPVRLARNERVASVRRFKHCGNAVGKHGLQGRCDCVSIGRRDAGAYSKCRNRKCARMGWATGAIEGECVSLGLR